MLLGCFSRNIYTLYGRIVMFFSGFKVATDP